MGVYNIYHIPCRCTHWLNNSDRCDEINLDGSNKSSSIVRNTYVHAQKMRAAMTYAFGRLHGLGGLPWHRSEATGAMVGNPSISDTVSSYMVSLRRRKVRAGEAQTSARAITSVCWFCIFPINPHNLLPMARTSSRKCMTSIVGLSTMNPSLLGSIARTRTLMLGVVAELVGCLQQPTTLHSCACFGLMKS